jgi:pimeloyl-[acyl-carrier protein] methyl ester esterase
MDGTGDLFAQLIAALPNTITTYVVRYPRDTILSPSQLEKLARSAFPSTIPFFLLAESFSTPIAIQCVTQNPSNLKGLILCAGFASTPVRGWKRALALLLGSMVFRLPVPEFVATRFLVGPDAQPSLLQSVRNAISSVNPKVLSSRLHTALTCDVRAELGQFTGPILYLQASNDRLIPRTHPEQIKRICPQTVVEVIPGPHLLLQREPERAAKAVEKFIQLIAMEEQDRTLSTHDAPHPPNRTN